MTDHMLIMHFEPKTGWSAPVIQPYQPLQLDPASSCFQYCPNVFEGMKAYVGPDGTPRLFRPELNMARLKTSVDRVALPVRKIVGLGWRKELTGSCRTLTRRHC